MNVEIIVVVELGLTPLSGLEIFCFSKNDLELLITLLVPPP